MTPMNTMLTTGGSMDFNASTLREMEEELDALRVHATFQRRFGYVGEAMIFERAFTRLADVQAAFREEMRQRGVS